MRKEKKFDNNKNLDAEKVKTIYVNYTNKYFEDENSSLQGRKFIRYMEIKDRTKNKEKNENNIAIAGKNLLNIKTRTIAFFRNLENIFKNFFTPEKKQEYISEYYEIPNTYSSSEVRIIPQTPTKLFATWDISFDDINTFKKQFGENYLENTYPLLLVTNTKTNTSFEIQVNDYTNSWYIDIPNNSSEYIVKYLRRFKENTNVETQIATSNKTISPNGKVLNNNDTYITFVNVQKSEIYNIPYTNILKVKSKQIYTNIYGITESGEIQTEQSS